MSKTRCSLYLSRVYIIVRKILLIYSPKYVSNYNSEKYCKGKILGVIRMYRMPNLIWVSYKKPSLGKKEVQRMTRISID